MTEDTNNGTPVYDTTASDKSETTQIMNELGRLGAKIAVAV